MVDMDAIYRRNEACAFNEVDGEIVIVHPEKGEISAINRTGAMIWSLTDGTKSLREIGEALARRFGQDEAEVLPHVERFAESMLSLGLFEEKKSE